jgi:hypothetical protein
VELSECPICFDMKPNVKMLVSALCERQLHMHCITAITQSPLARRGCMMVHALLAAVHGCVCARAK